jgi:hypothetical protein
MQFRRLTRGGAFASLRGESAGSGRPETGAGRSGWLAPRVLRWLVRVTVVGLAAGLTGCGSLSVDSAPEQKQKVVAERAQARWDALIKGDLDAAYQFLSAGSKAATPLATYKAKIKPGMWRAVKVDRIECERNVCKVITLITYDAKRMKGIETPFDENWIIENGSAWYVYR